MPRVLLIEDSPTQAQRLAFILEDAGFEVDLATDANHGFEQLAATHFDLVLTDLLLPGDSGFDICRRLKTDPRYHRLPVVVLTSQADPANVLRGLEAGADAFMTKNREPADIIAILRRALVRGAQPGPNGTDRTHVSFLNQEFAIAADREQLLDVLVSAFEEVVHLNQRSQANATALREANTQLVAAFRELGERNQQLQQLADDLEASGISERQTHAELRRAHEELKKAESQLVQSEKLAALGQMVAGVAHEINNPLSFVSNNLAVLQRDVRSLRDLLNLYQEAEAVLSTQQSELHARLHELADRMDLTYTLGNLQGLLDRSRDGLKRIQQIVKDLRDFARLDDSDLQEVDLNAGITSTLNIMRNQAKKQEVVLEADLQPLPSVTCYPARINQVVLNLVANAIDACPPGGQVTVSTRAEADVVVIQVADTGSGIAPAIRDKIFDPFFTTKPPGKGTGLGLSISYSIVQAHGGKIDFESTAGQGTRFFVSLPSKAERGVG